MGAFIKKLFIFLAIFVVILFVVVVPLLFPPIHETNNISDYGRYVGNYNNDIPSAFINSFFPSELTDNYSQLEYHYRAKQFDTYSYEVYLSFCIADSKQFSEYIEGLIAKHGNPAEFVYDNTYEEIIISNVYEIASNKGISGDDTYRILTAQVGKILISCESQHIIYVAIGLHDGGGTLTSELCYFFDKFHIDPVEYAISSNNLVMEYIVPLNCNSMIDCCSLRRMRLL